MKQYESGVVVEYYYRETPLHATTQEDIHPLLSDGYEFEDDRLTAPPKNQTIDIILTN